MRPIAPALRLLSVVVFTLSLVIFLAAWAPWRARTYHGASHRIGAGTVRSFVTRRPGGAPIAVGAVLTASALEQLPSRPNTHSRCFDVNGDGKHGHHECIGDEERVLDFPAQIAGARLPFTWMTVNWNAAGHPAPYNRPHFDFHFFAWDRERIEAITPGRCGELVDCDHFKRATRLLAPEYAPPGHIDVGAVVPRMGNHLLDSRSPEIADSAPFTRTFIYGAYDGELIFWEPMITLDFLRRTTDACFEIRQPQAFKRSGYYPTRYCVRHDTRADEYRVSLEGFTYAGAY